MPELYSNEYFRHATRGPFPGRIDPWAEVGYYFHQIHGSMISELFLRLSEPLLRRGYITSREASLQVLAQTQPDLSVRLARREVGKPADQWNYPAAATEALAEPGVAISGEVPELDAMYIRSLQPGELVTIVEVISPTNKIGPQEMAEYQEKRTWLIRDKKVNIVEIDLTRSVKRLLADVIASTYPYHIAVHLPHERSRFIGMDFGQLLKRFALPLHREVIPVETQEIYDHAYQQVGIAAQLDDSGHYSEERLPFPSLLTDAQRQESLSAVQTWQTKLAELRKPSDG